MQLIYDFFIWIGNVVTWLWQSIVSIITWIYTPIKYIFDLVADLPGWALAMIVPALIIAIIIRIIHLGGGGE